MSGKRRNPSIPRTTINLTPQKPVLPLETMSQFAEPVIPDEIRNPVQVQYNQTFSGSRLASAAAGLGRDDELPHSLWRKEKMCGYRAKLSK